MKRSEMIQKIIDSVYYHTDEDIILREDEAELVLKDLELFGMKPSGYEALIRDGTFWSNGWEPEDEKK